MQNTKLILFKSNIISQSSFLPNEIIIYQSDNIDNKGKTLDISLSHNYITEYLSIPKRFQEQQLVFKNLFQNMKVHILITNYRLLIEPIFEGTIGKAFLKFFNKQPVYVKEFFNIPLGQINRCESHVNPILDQD